MQDLVVDFDEITQLQDSRVFSLERGGLIPYMEEDDLVQGIQIEVNANLTLIQRSGYHIIDLLSDVGGLQGLLISAISVFLSVWNYRNLENYLAVKLFKFENTDSVELGSAKAVPSQVQTLKLFCMDKVLPSKLVCCRRDARQSAMERAHEALEKELDILEVIRFRRFVLLALKQTLPPDEHQKLKAHSQIMSTED